MRNYELLKEIAKICQSADHRDEGGYRDVNIAKIAELIKNERPEIGA